MLLITELFFILILCIILAFVYRHERRLSKEATSQAKIEEYWDGEERRRHFRFKKELEVAYAVEKKPHLKRNGKTIDISEGGMKLLIDEKLAPGMILDLKIMIDRNNTAEVEGEIMWSQDIKELDPYGKRLFYAGIRFLYVKEPFEKKLIDYIRTLAPEPVAA